MQKRMKRSYLDENALETEQRRQIFNRSAKAHVARALETAQGNIPEAELPRAKRSLFQAIRDTLLGHESVQQKLARARKQPAPLDKGRKAKRSGPSTLRKLWAIRGRR